MLGKTLQPFYTAYIIITYLICLLGAFPLILLLGTMNNSTGRKAVWTIVHYWAIGWLFCIGMPMSRLGKKPDASRYVYIANHISYMDTVLIYAAVPYYFRTLAKKEMAKIPVFGFVYKQIAILVDRSSNESRSKSMRLMWRQLKNECNIAVFPEGTFNENNTPLKDFYDGAFRLAINTQTPVLPMVFPDTFDRWHFGTAWRLKPGRNRVVYLEPFDTAGMTMEDLPQLKADIHSAMEKVLVEYKS